MTRIRSPYVLTAARVIAGSLLAAVACPTDTCAHDPAKEMYVAAKRLMISLDPQQREFALFGFDSDRRDFWHYVPDKFIEPEGKRWGLRVADMTPRQRLLLHALLSTGLSHKGYRQSVTIMTLEQILHELEQKNPIRDPQLYYVSIFGEPALDKTWSWRLEGHHLSLNFTLVDGKWFSVTPSFFGTNPARVKEGPFAGMEVLATEQNLARKLVTSLSAQQRQWAVIAAKAPRDIITAQQRKAEKGSFLPPQGIRFDQLDDAQQKRLLRLVNEYAAKYRPPIVRQIDERTPIADGQGMFFAWAGGLEPGAGHYYRVQTPGFLFEYDNTQNDANHVHAVWREFDGDFGADLLRQHYEESPLHAKNPKP